MGVCVYVQLSFWVCSEIISIKDAKVRGLLIEKFIEVAKVIRVKNYVLT